MVPLLPAQGDYSRLLQHTQIKKNELLVFSLHLDLVSFKLLPLVSLP